MKFASLSVKGQDTCNITCKKVRAPSLEGNFLIIHHICTPVLLTDGPIFSSAVTFICNKLRRRTEKRSLCWQKRTGQPENEQSSSIGKSLDCRGHCLDAAFFQGQSPWINHSDDLRGSLFSKEKYFFSCVAGHLSEFMSVYSTVLSGQCVPLTSELSIQYSVCTWSAVYTMWTNNDVHCSYNSTWSRAVCAFTMWQKW